MLCSYGAPFCDAECFGKVVTECTRPNKFDGEVSFYGGKLGCSGNLAGREWNIVVV